MLDKIIAYAKDNEIQLVTMNGSRVNENIEADPYQDYDVVFFVDNIDTFEFEPDVFGDILISQQNSIDADTIIFMCQYRSGERIDLQVRNMSSLESYLKEDSLTKVIYNNTNIKIDITTSDVMHVLRNPKEEEFLDHINEMYWVSLYVVKALKRGQLNYASVLMTTIILEELSLMLGYNVNIKHDKEINYGMGYKYLGAYLEAGAEYYYSLYTKGVSIALLMEVLDWYDVLVDNVALTYNYEKPIYHKEIVEYIKNLDIQVVT